MASIPEKTSEGIVYKPSREMALPDLDVLTLLFGKLCILSIPSLSLKQS
jgi:hypothetical protein